MENQYYKHYQNLELRNNLTKTISIKKEKKLLISLRSNENSLKLIHKFKLYSAVVELFRIANIFCTLEKQNDRFLELFCWLYPKIIFEKTF
jgi:hypothetical protein